MNKPAPNRLEWSSEPVRHFRERREVRMQTVNADSYLYSLISSCLGGRCSPDAWVRRGVVEKYPASVRLPLSAQDVYEGSLKRFRVLLKDLSDYGMRRDYTFPTGERSPEEEKELGWLEGRFSPAIQARQKQTLSRSDVVIGPYEPHVRRRSFGECVASLVESFSSGSVPEWLVRWLCLDMGYNLDWLLLGLGPMCAEWAGDGSTPHQLPPSGTRVDPATGEIRYEDVASLRERQLMSLWSFTDWQWLHNLRAVVKAVYKPPTIPLLSRLTAGWRVPSQLPQMPHILVWVDWLAVWCTHTFMEGPSAPGWKQDVIDYIVSARNSALLILGLGNQAGSQYRSAKAEPTACVLRLAWMVRMVVERRGREGFLDYLDLVDDEARARGFDGLLDVFHQRTWFAPSRPGRKTGQTSDAAAEAGTDAADSAERNYPWGVPAEAGLRPLELMKLVAAGGIPADPDPDMAWLQLEGLSAKKQMSISRKKPEAVSVTGPEDRPDTALTAPDILQNSPETAAQGRAAQQDTAGAEQAESENLAENGATHEQ